MAENVKNEKDYFASLFDPEDKNYIFSQYEDIGDLFSGLVEQFDRGEGGYWGGKRGFDIADPLDAIVSILQIPGKAIQRGILRPSSEILMGLGNIINQKGVMYDEEDLESARKSFDPEGVLDKYGDFNLSDLLGNMFKPGYGVNLSQSQLGGYSPMTVAEEISHGIEHEEGGIPPNMFEPRFPLENYGLRLQEETRAKMDAFWDVAQKEGLDQALLNFPHLAGTWATYLFSPSIMGGTPRSYGEGAAGDPRYYDLLKSGIDYEFIDDLFENQSMSDEERYKIYTEDLGYTMPPIDELPAYKDAVDPKLASSLWFDNQLAWDLAEMKRLEEIQDAGPIDTILNWMQRRAY